MRLPRAVLAAIAILTTTLGVSPARAGELQVSPVLVELGPARRSGLVTLKNLAQAKARYQVRAYAWAQDERGAMQLAATTDLVAYPLLLELAPGEERVLRIGTTARPEAREKSYRIFVEELPDSQAPGQPGQVRVLTRVGIPVFFAPERPQTKGSVAFLSVQARRATLRIHNTGTVHLRPSAVSVVGLADDGTRTFEVPLNAWYILAGDGRLYDADLPADGCARTRQLVAKVAADPGDLEARVMLPDGACAR